MTRPPSLQWAWTLALLLTASAPLAANDQPPLLRVDLIVTDPASLPKGLQRPASVGLNFPDLIAKAGLTGVADMSTLRVLHAEGSPVSGPRFAYEVVPGALPIRWDDASIPEEIPVVARAVHDTTGKLTPTLHPRAVVATNVIQNTGKGRLVWAHTSSGTGTSRYRLEVAVRPEETHRLPPRGWIGDGTVRFTNAPASSTGVGHTRIDLAQWNDEGRYDLVYGDASGRLYLMRGLGKPGAPAFAQPEFIVDTNGDSIDVGFGAAPLVVDWDRDGLDDLLIGTHWNRILFFKNEGTRSAPKFSYHGPLTIGGQPLAIPYEPVIGRPPGAFKRDYYPVLSMADWKGGGEPELLVGGYTTGRIFRFAISGRAKDGTPILESLGPITLEDGEVLNVGDWGAAPTVGDLTGDGLPDLVSGNFAMGKAAKQRKESLRFYRNVGKSGQPLFREADFPAANALPRGSLFTPRLIPGTEEGKFDLIVSGGADIYLLKNVGTPSEPSFRTPKASIRPAWGITALGGTQWIDWDGDGREEMIARYTVSHNDGKGDPFIPAAGEGILPRGETIAHPSGIGDDWFHPRFFAFRKPGTYDLLFGDWYGQIWLHRRQDDGRYDKAGELLKLESGEPIKVGPKGEDPSVSFRALQGARTTFTAHDFDGNGTTDLIVGDTYGHVRHFRNIGTNDQPVFKDEGLIGDLRTRLTLDLIDWNRDGLMDVIACSANGRIRIFLNEAGAPDGFGNEIDPKLPPYPVPSIVVGDFSGSGERDLMITSPEGVFWLQRTFLDHGYAEGRVEAVGKATQ